MDKIGRIFLIKLAQKSCFFSNIDGPVIFFKYLDIQLKSEFKKSFRNIIQYILKILKGFWDMLYVCINKILNITKYSYQSLTISILYNVLYRRGGIITKYNT